MSILNGKPFTVEEGFRNVSNFEKYWAPAVDTLFTKLMKKHHGDAEYFAAMMQGMLGLVVSYSYQNCQEASPRLYGKITLVQFTEEMCKGLVESTKSYERRKKYLDPLMKI